MTRARDLNLEQQISLLSGSDFWHTQGLPEHDVPAILLSDGPHGLRAQEDGGDHLGLGGSRPATCFPTAVTIASSWDEELIEQIGRAVAAEALSQGVAVVLGPGMNIKRHPLCGRNFEYLSEDPLVSGRLAAAMVRGIQSRGVGACVKHFAVNNQEGHRFVVDAVVDERTLRELYLSGFEHAVTTSRPWTVMAAYNLVNGTYCTDHHRLLTTVLRDEWGFDGLVMSDWGATNDRPAGVHAGMDLEMPGSAGVNDAVVAEAVRDGALDAAAVESCADRVLDLVARSRGQVAVEAPFAANNDLSRRAAAESAVLLTNDGLLPLDPGLSVAVIGAFAQHPRYQGSGSSLVNPTSVTTAWDSFTERGVSATYAAGYDPITARPDQGLIEEAVAVASTADVVVLMAGLPGIYESEGFDRPDLHLPAQQEQLIEAVTAVNLRTVVALSNGAPVVMPWVDRPAAIVESYLGGQASGGALLDVLYGDVEPGGRLAETFPVSQQDVPADPWFPGHPHQVEYREGLFVGYRFHTTAGVPPLFPFGHGLSYTEFEYGPAEVDSDSLIAGEPVTVTVPVTNIGHRAGSDVVQVYVYDRTGVVQRPRRELRGFAKVRLRAGETALASVRLDARAFSFYDTSCAGWRIPTGTFDIEIGRSSTDIIHTLTVTIHGGVTQAPETPETALLAVSDSQFRARLGRPIPSARPVTPFTRLSTVGEIQVTRVGRSIKTVLKRFSGADFDEIAETDAAMGKMFEKGLDEMPLRTTVLFSEGKIPWSVLDAAVDLMNGRPAAAASRSAGAVVSSAARGLRRLTRRG